MKALVGLLVALLVFAAGAVPGQTEGGSPEGGAGGDCLRDIGIGTGDIDVEIGIGCKGKGLILITDGTDPVEPEAEANGLAVAIGIGMRTRASGASNFGDVEVDASSEEGIAAAAGIVALGRHNALRNLDGGSEDGGSGQLGRGQIDVSAVGNTAVALGMGAAGRGNVLENHTELVAEADGNVLAAALGMGLAGSRNEAYNAGEVSVEANADEGVAAAAGMAAVGKKNWLINGGWSEAGDAGEDEGQPVAGDMSVKARGDYAAALGMGVAGRKSYAINPGRIQVVAQSEEGAAAAIGMAGIGRKHTIVNQGPEDPDGDDDEAGEAELAGRLQVEASGPLAIGLGMGVLGTKSDVGNDGAVEVDATGDMAVAIGMGAIGFGNTVANARDLDVAAEGNEVAAALGMGALGAGNQVLNWGAVDVAAGSNEGVAAAVGMGALGGQNLLLNTGVGAAGEGEDAAGGLKVQATGHQVVGLGMGALGSRNLAVNTGDIVVDAISYDDETGNEEDDGWAVAAGMIGSGKRNWLVNARLVEDSDDEDQDGSAAEDGEVALGGYINVYASGEQAFGLGMGVDGSRSVALNAGHVHVHARGDEAAAIGMGATGFGNTLANAGDLDVTAIGNEVAAALGMGVAGFKNDAINAANLNVSAVGDEAAAVGMATIGAKNVLLNTATASDAEDELPEGGLQVWATGDRSVSLGMGAVGFGNVAANTGDMFVSADEGVEIAVVDEGDDNDEESWAVAAGMAAVGKGNWLFNAGTVEDDEFVPAQLHVTAAGDRAVALGIGLMGTSLFDDDDADDERINAPMAINEPRENGATDYPDGNVAFNAGELRVQANGEEFAAAVGMAAAGEGNVLINVAEFAAVVPVDPDPFADNGEDEPGVNVEGGLAVGALGNGAVAVGMAVAGTENWAVNKGHVAAVATGLESEARGAVAIGMAALGDDNTLVNKGAWESPFVADDLQGDDENDINEDLPLGGVTAYAFGQSAAAAGMAAVGDGNTLINSGEVAVAATRRNEEPDNGDEADDGEGFIAGGMVVFGSGNALVNKGEDAAVTVVAEGNGAIAVGMGAFGEENRIVHKDGMVSASAEGHHVVAWGIWADGDENKVVNKSDVVASVSGWDIEAVGLSVSGSNSFVLNTGNIDVSAEENALGPIPSSDDALVYASGIIAIGDDHHAVNRGTIEVTIDAVGEESFVAAAGMYARGSGTTIENYRLSGDESEARASLGEFEIVVEVSGAEAWAAGIEVDGDEHNVLNEGDIAVSSTGHGSLAIGISAYHDADEEPAYASNIEVDNKGTIMVSAAGTESGALGISVYEGSNYRIHNAGTIAVFASGDDAEAYGISAGEIGADIVNEGTIYFDAGYNVEGGDAHLAGWAIGIGVDEYGEGTVKNAGQIIAGMADEDNEASGLQSHVARSFGIAADAIGGTLTIVNEEDARIEGGNGTEVAAGVLVVAWDQQRQGGVAEGEINLQNAGTITVDLPDGAKGAAVLIGPVEDRPAQDAVVGLGAIYITNTGLIDGGAADAVAIGMASDQQRHRTIYIENKGTIIGDIDIEADTAYVELKNGSSIEGSILLGSGNDTAVLWGGADLDKLVVVDGEDGQDYLLLMADSSDEGADLQGRMSNFETVILDSGTWTLDKGTMATGTTRVGERGVLVLPDGFELGPGGVIGGTGTIRGTLRNAAGTLAPGFSPGTLTIEGNYFHGEEATYHVEITLSDGHDKLLVNAHPTDPDQPGNVTLEGGRVLVDLEGKPVNHYGSTSYTIIETQGNLEGEFDGAEGAVASAFIDYDLDYVHGTDGRVTLTVTGSNFSSVAQSANEKSVARILDDILENGGAGSKEVEALYTARTKLEARSWMNQLSGEVYTVYPVAASVGITRFVDAVTEGMHQPGTEDGRRGWVAAYGATGKLKADADLADAKLKYAGGVAGMHLYSGPAGKAGLTAGFQHNTVRMDERHSKLTGDGYQIGAYGQIDVGDVRMTGVLAHGRTRYDGERRLAFGYGEDRVNRTATSRFDSTELAASFRGVVLRPNPSGGTTVEPSFGLTWLRLSRNGFHEDGAEDLNLQLDSYSANWFRGDLGVGLTFPQKALRSGWALDSSVRVAWVHDFSKPSRDVTGRLKARPDEPLRTKGTAHKADGFQVGLDLHWHRPQDTGMQWMLSYGGEFRSDVQVHSLQAGLGFQF